MVLTGLIQEILALLNGLLGHWVAGTPSAFIVGPDYEWRMLGTGQFSLTPKGNYLMGAVADIATFGAILVDWIVQALLGNPTFINQAPTG
jgi:hypothetical protein